MRGLREWRAVLCTAGLGPSIHHLKPCVGVGRHASFKFAASSLALLLRAAKLCAVVVVIVVVFRFEGWVSKGKEEEKTQVLEPALLEQSMSGEKE